MIDISKHLPADPSATSSWFTPTMATMQGSQILKIAGQVRTLAAEGRAVCNLTVGDFSPSQFRIPHALEARITEAVAEGQTNYPPADGVPELKSAILDLYRRDLGLDYPEGSVCVGSGARPPIYAAWRLFVEPGDRTVSFLPMWNVGYYAHLCQADHRFVHTSAETNFFPTVEQFAEAVRGARLVVINSPLNPTGTVIERDVLAGIAAALVDENRRRASTGGRPAILLYDQVYWMLTATGVQHHNPVTLVPECAPYVIQVDAISKCFAGTGLRVGWAVLPPSLQGRMKALIGHMGAWAPRPVQMATAWMLSEPTLVEDYMHGMRRAVQQRLDCLYDGIHAMKEAGLPVDAIAPQGAIYMSLHIDMVGKGFDSNEQIRSWLLEEAGFAVVPFQAFDMPDESGWFRASVGAVGVDDLEAALARLESALRRRLGATG